jgi:hypothetical protein
LRRIVFSLFAALYAGAIHPIVNHRSDGDVGFVQFQ